MDDENILARIGGEHVAAALRTLPDAETAKEDSQEAAIDVPGFGKVRFSCRRVTGRQGKYRYKFWSAFKAVKANSDSEQ
jgi:hypothetical protein